ncbi:hypothetical protein Bca4012_056574 [Brassica carinata]
MRLQHYQNLHLLLWSLTNSIGLRTSEMAPSLQSQKYSCGQSDKKQILREKHLTEEINLTGPQQLALGVMIKRHCYILFSYAFLLERFRKKSISTV